MAVATGALLEFYVPCVKFEGLKTNKDVFVGDGATVTLPSTTTIGGSSVVALGDITSSSTTATAFTVTNTGVFTGTDVVEFTANSATTGRVFAITANGLTSGAGMLITSSGTLVTTGNLLTITANSATTAAGLLRINANGLTDGKALIIASSTTGLTSTGRLFHVSHTGNAGVSTVLAEVSSAAADETVVARISASAALALGVLLDVSGAAVTTGTLLDISDADALTTGTAVNIVSNSTSNGTRSLVRFVNDNTAATGTTPLYIQQDAVTSTNFKKLITLGTFSIWTSDETSPNTALSGTKGDICLNGSATGQAFWCTGTTNWTALA